MSSTLNWIVNPTPRLSLDLWSLSNPPGTDYFERVFDTDIDEWVFRFKTLDGFIPAGGNFTADTALFPIVFAEDTVCTFSAYIKYTATADPASPVLAVHYDGPLFYYEVPIGDGEWNRCVLTYTAPAGEIQVPVPISDPRTLRSEIRVTRVQFEVGSEATDYFDGDTRDDTYDYVWLGASYQSPSRRYDPIEQPTAIEPQVEVSWDGSGAFDGTYDDVTDDTAAVPGLGVQAGRDQARSLSPPMVSAGSFALFNQDGTYSQERGASPVYQRVLPGKPARLSVKHGPRLTYRGGWPYRGRVAYRGKAAYRLLTGPLDDIAQDTALGQQRVSFGVLGGMAALRGRRVTVGVQEAIRTDEALALLLDAADWPTDKREIATGDSTLLYWWADEADAYEAAVQLLASEGPGALYEDGAGVIHFENRNYRTTETRSTDSQAIFRDIQAPAATRYRERGAYRARRPYRGNTADLWFTGMQYDIGFKNIVNRATFATRRRTLGALAAVWSYGGDLELLASQTITLIARPNDPFLNAVTPVLATDYTVAGGTVSVSLLATSGLVAFITITALTGTPTVSGLQLRAQPLASAYETLIQSSVDASASIAKFGERSMAVAGWPETDPNQAQAVCDAWVNRYKAQRPQVNLTIRNADWGHLYQILARRVSDRISLSETNTGMSGDVWIERKDITVVGAGGRGVMCVLGCEKVDEVSGSLWDDPDALWDDPGTVWAL